MIHPKWNAGLYLEIERIAASFDKKFFEAEACDHGCVVETQGRRWPEEGKVGEGFCHEGSEVEVVADAAAKEDGFAGKGLGCEVGFARNVEEGSLLE